VSPKLRPLSGADVVRALRGFGFDVVGTSGSHAKLRRVLADGRRETLTIPLHQSLASGTAHAIFRQAARYIVEAELRQFFFKE
jgi:predicted RNA binding protein YcfA (HicA-like mRNA interferase family)